MMIHRVRIARVNVDMTTVDVLVFRMAGTQDQAELFGQRLRTRWMRQNPGWATVMITDWPRSDELGGQHVMPDARLIEDAPLVVME